MCRYLNWTCSITFSSKRLCEYSNLNIGHLTLEYEAWERQKEGVIDNLWENEKKFADSSNPTARFVNSHFWNFWLLYFTSLLFLLFCFFTFFHLTTKMTLKTRRTIFDVIKSFYFPEKFRVKFYFLFFYCFFIFENLVYSKYTCYEKKSQCVIEWQNKEQKMAFYVTNKSLVLCVMAEHYLQQKCWTFCNLLLLDQNKRTVVRTQRHKDIKDSAHTCFRHCRLTVNASWK